MFSVALIGIDGAGKTTIAKRLEHTLPFPIKYLYMGLNVESSNMKLPTTRLILHIKQMMAARREPFGRSEPTLTVRNSSSVKMSAVKGLRSSLRLANLLAEECFRYCLAWFYQQRGYVVVFDRWFLADRQTSNIAWNNTSLPYSERLHGYLLHHLFPEPDMVICLDAPAEVSFARKGEDTLTSLDHRRRRYLLLKDIAKNFNVVDAGLTEEIVLREVSTLVCNFYKARAAINSTRRKTREEPT